MQQATNSSGIFPPATGNVPPANPARRADSPRYVINLCASTTPVGLVQPSHAGLKRFTFFVSRRLEEGRERFRLHMGYFDSQEEAEKILDLVRDVYPAAWAGVAPGIKLRSRSASDAPEAAPIGPATAAAVQAQALAPPPPPDSAAAPAGTSARNTEAAAAALSLSNIRATIASLADTAPTDAAAPGTLDAPAVLQLLESAAPTPAERPAPTVHAAPETSVRAASAVVTPPPVATAPPKAAVRPAVAPRPAAGGATPPRAVAAPRVARTAQSQNEPAVYAVQLLWSVQPIDLGAVPQLAIFTAYTLYGAEGNRDGRRWYGLRLGFFTDAVSAKQVAQYVRSEFRSVSVVPVSVRERERAGAAAARPLPAVSPEKPAGVELNFIEDVPTDTASSGSRPALQASDQPGENNASATGARDRAAAVVGMGARILPGKRAKLRVGQGRPAAKRPGDSPPLTLEETLEVLGASELQIDHGRGELVNDVSQRERKAAPGGSRFGRLINRLAERLGNG